MSLAPAKDSITKYRPQKYKLRAAKTVIIQLLLLPQLLQLLLQLLLLLPQRAQ